MKTYAYCNYVCYVRKVYIYIYKYYLVSIIHFEISAFLFLRRIYCNLLKIIQVSIAALISAAMDDSNVKFKNVLNQEYSLYGY